MMDICDRNRALLPLSNPSQESLMSLQLGRAFGGGVKRSLSRSGLLAFVLITLYQFGVVGAINTIIVRAVPSRYTPQVLESVGFVFPLSTRMAIGLGAASLLIGAWVFVVTTRLLARPIDLVSSIPSSAFTRRLVLGVLSALLVSLVLSVVIPLGFILLFVPGIFLLVSLQFAIFAVGVEDQGPLSALSRSWNLARGNRWKLLILVLVIAVLGGLVGIMTSVVTYIDPLAGQLLSIATMSVVLLLTYGILADAFVQIRKNVSPSL